MPEQYLEKLSASQEDYLEAIFNLSNAGKVVRGKDVANSLSVSKSSVTAAIHTLAEKKLIHYKPYGYITLTDTGLQAAALIAKKHDVIESFFVEVLGVDAEMAKEAACRVEHSLGKTIVNRLLEFVEFVTHHSDDGVDFVEQFRKFCAEISKQQDPLGKSGVPLSTIQIGSEVTLAGINAGSELRSRLAAMGLVPKAKFKVVSNNASGPFVVSVKGSKIMLGRSMVHKITVKTN